ncbi:hypothetical protein fugu_004479 [Takifugu bimaculatus]|uniref:Uncharacterized protein n=1 Tax=Takifugu bimaculatus TaxID=433685 RepID=A0A4Z2BDH4_9TELE|nr:hypothetical protein fugu_004479 [Takifugu bimaculatus]
MLQLLAITKPSLSTVRRQEFGFGSWDCGQKHGLYSDSACDIISGGRFVTGLSMPKCCHDCVTTYEVTTGSLVNCEMASVAQDLSHLVWPNGPLCNNTTNRETVCALLSAAKQVAQINTVGNKSTGGFQGLFTGNQFERSS